jgi:cell division cycle 14
MSFSTTDTTHVADSSLRYERYERVDQGDFNWVSPQFVAFASPQSEPTTPIPISSPAYATLPSCIPEIQHARIPEPFKNVLTHFVQRNVGLVVRLNSELYCPTYFTALGIQHIDMIFEDGTCPALAIVRKFIKLARDTIAKKKGIAVHCKAGLGRTGCLIGAYLIYRHGFTANEVIAFMRFMRPGMVVGPQQHWLHLNQGQFREWYLEDQWKAKMELSKPSTPRGMSTKTPMRLSSGAQMATPERSSAPRTALGEIDGNDVANAYPDENLPAPTPGQPRKYARMDPRQHPYSRSTSGAMSVNGTKAESEVVATETHRQSTNGLDSEEELILQRAASRRSQSKSPGSKGKARSVSYTTTTTTVTKSFDLGDTVGIYEDDGDVNFRLEDTNAIWDELAQEQENLKLSTRSEKAEATTRKTPRSASGMGAMGVAKTRSTRESPRRSGGEDKMKIRKTSGRVGSASHGPVSVKR